MLSEEIVNVSFPDLAEIQQTSFKKFLCHGLGEVLSFLPTITDPTGKLQLEFFAVIFPILEYLNSKRACDTTLKLFDVLAIRRTTGNLCCNALN